LIDSLIGYTPQIVTENNVPGKDTRYQDAIQIDIQINGPKGWSLYD